ncbi:O-methyltransferase [Pseudoglutamicibacter cumminsii]|uniref:O-methyltransferase n=1 Tax=Pseudoglutamicibacter cumminsii TaxID=156979 RepID=UPI0025532E85|nr:class I SAM-dependent methyltransferase [Pseudoglutamicibacter cumminsii]
MSVSKHSSWSYTEALPREDAVLTAARSRGQELGVEPVTPAVAQLITVLTANARVEAAVEVGTGVGVSSLSILRGMAPDGVLTTIEKDYDHLDAARYAFKDEKLPSRRVRTINGRSQEVLPRLADASYNLVLLDGDPNRVAKESVEALRLLVPGGLLIVNDALDSDRVPAPAVRKPSTIAARKAQRWLRDHEDVFSVTIPSATGVMLAVKKR